ncbi:major facilitator superfamily domain-containing protein [Chytriomyces cf. hyalinus JEL632]|nr:major facilitator superfamily domain-containing protein [Chytriomyces cf. hyalinus JEL632]
MHASKHCPDVILAQMPAPKAHVHASFSEASFLRVTESGTSLVLNHQQSTDDQASKTVRLPELSLEDADEVDYPDGGLNAWMAVAASFVGHFFVFGLMYSFGIYQDYYVGLGVGSTAQVAFIGGTGSVFIPGLAIVAGRLAEKFGFRPVVFAGSVLLSLGVFLSSFSTSLPVLICTQGALFGMGASFVFIPSVSITAQWFDKKRGLATGIAVSGAGFGGLVWSLATESLLHSIGLAWTLRVTGMTCLVFLLAATPFFKTRIPASKTSQMDVSALKDTRFWFLLFSGFFSVFAMFVPVYFLPVFARERLGLGLAEGARLLSLYNGGSTAGRIVMGFGADAVTGPSNALVLAMWVTTASNFAWLAIDNLSALTVFSIVNGFVGGAFWGLLPTVAAGMFGMNARLVTILSMLYSSLAFGDFGSPPLSGFIKDSFGLNAMVMYAAILALAGAVCGTCARFSHENKFWKRV